MPGKPKKPELRKPYYDVADGMEGLKDVIREMGDTALSQLGYAVERALDHLRDHLNDNYNWD